MKSLNDVIWAAAFVLVGALLITLQYDDVMLVMGGLSTIGGGVWLGLIYWRVKTRRKGHE